jgi:hypothetical protein
MRWASLFFGEIAMLEKFKTWITNVVELYYLPG